MRGATGARNARESLRFPRPIRLSDSRHACACAWFAQGRWWRRAAPLARSHALWGLGRFQRSSRTGGGGRRPVTTGDSELLWWTPMACFVHCAPENDLHLVGPPVTPPLACARAAPLAAARRLAAAGERGGGRRRAIWALAALVLRRPRVPTRAPSTVGV